DVGLLPGAPVREMPAEEEREAFGRARLDRPAVCHRGDRSRRLAGAFVEPAVGAEVVPEVEQAVTPGPIRPAGPATHVLAVHPPEGDGAVLLRVRIGSPAAQEHAVHANRGWTALAG